MVIDGKRRGNKLKYGREPVEPCYARPVRWQLRMVLRMRGRRGESRENPSPQRKRDDRGILPVTSHPYRKLPNSKMGTLCIYLE
jgi:hypothetical protein